MSEKLTPWQTGYNAYMAGEVVPIPSQQSTWAERLRNAGWLAAQREAVIKFAEETLEQNTYC